MNRPGPDASEGDLIKGIPEKVVKVYESAELTELDRYISNPLTPIQALDALLASIGADEKIPPNEALNPDEVHGDENVSDFVQRIKAHFEGRRYHQYFVCSSRLLLDYLTRKGYDDQVKFAVSAFASNMQKYNPLSTLTLLRKIIDQSVSLQSIRVLLTFKPLLEKTQNTLILAKAIIAFHLLGNDYLEEAEDLLFDYIAKDIDQAYGLNSSTEAEFHRAAAAYFWKVQKQDLFYRHAILYLEGRESDEGEKFDAEMAQNLCQAVLLSPKIYSFTELLQHPILRLISPGGAEYSTRGIFRDMVVMLNSGDLSVFNTFVHSRSEQLKLHKLTGHIDILTKKLKMFALLELAFTKPHGERLLTFGEISEGCGVPINEVELLTLDVMANNLMKGQIDQIKQVFTFTSLQPRVLDQHKIQLMAQQFATWSRHIKDIANSLQKMAPEISQQVASL